MRPRARFGHIDGRRLLASGALWTVVYNLLWGSAWFALMRREWSDAAAAVGRPLPWTAELWFAWVWFTLPLGVAIMAHAESGGRSTRKAVVAVVAVWLLMSGGMTVWGLQESFGARVLALDALVNLVAMVAASVVGAWSLRPARAGAAGSAPHRPQPAGHQG